MHYSSFQSHKSSQNINRSRNNVSGIQRHPRKITSVSESEIIALIASGNMDSERCEEDFKDNELVAKFENFSISQKLLKNVIEKGYITPTQIQAKAIPEILNNRDVIGVAQTGTGKTAAFLIPLIEKISQNPTERVLIITPTREIALQIRDEFLQFSQGFQMHSSLLIGGMNIERQKESLKNKPEFVFGTPGRIKDLLRSPHFSLNQFANVVLDEADRMVDIGFIKDINYFINLLPRKRLSLFFSATIDQKVKSILENFVTNPVIISVNRKNTLSLVDQKIIRSEPGIKKIDTLHDLLIRENCTRTILFGRTKWGIVSLEKELVQRGFRVATIHGNKNQNQRQRALTEFKNGMVEILLATDVASRGLDIPNVTHVINYDIPATKEDYIHRIGRTGRAEKRGVAFTFFT